MNKKQLINSKGSKKKAEKKENVKKGPARAETQNEYAAAAQKLLDNQQDLQHRVDIFNGHVFVNVSLI
jgi:hypothetical protein